MPGMKANITIKNLYWQDYASHGGNPTKKHNRQNGHISEKQ